MAIPLGKGQRGPSAVLRNVLGSAWSLVAWERLFLMGSSLMHPQAPPLPGPAAPQAILASLTAWRAEVYHL